MSQSKIKILIVDDNKPFAWALRKALEKHFELEVFSEFVPEFMPENVINCLGNNSYNALILNVESKGIDVLEEIRLCDESKLWNIPIFLLSFKDSLSLIKENPQHNLLILSDGCRLVKYPINFLSLYDILNNLKPIEDKNEILKYISFAWGSELTDEKHGIANEFGAIKLAEGAWLAKEIGTNDYDKIYKDIREKIHSNKWRVIKKYELSMIQGKEIEKSLFKTSKHIPKGKYELRNALKGGKVLFIDDRYDAGWNTILNFLFCKTSAHEKVVSVKTCKEANSVSDLKDDYGLIDYDLILLDARLTPNDQRLKGSTKEYEKLSSLKWLRKIRKKDKSVPVILFTGSERSDIYRLFEKEGISGAFIKELPGQPKGWTRDNFKDFKKLLIEELGKEYLRYIWRNIRIVQEISKKRRGNTLWERVKLHISFLERAYKLLRYVPPSHEPSLLFGRYAQAVHSIALFAEEFKEDLWVPYFGIRGAAAHPQQNRFVVEADAILIFYFVFTCLEKIIPQRQVKNRIKGNLKKMVSKFSYEELELLYFTDCEVKIIEELTGKIRDSLNALKEPRVLSIALAKKYSNCKTCINNAIVEINTEHIMKYSREDLIEALGKYERALNTSGVEGLADSFNKLKELIEKSCRGLIPAIFSLGKYKDDKIIGGLVNWRINYYFSRQMSEDLIV